MQKINIKTIHTHRSLAKRLTRSISMLMIAVVGLVTISVATVPSSNVASAACGSESTLGIPTWHRYLDGTPDDCRIISDDEEIGAKLAETGQNIAAIFIAIIEAAAIIGAVVALIMVFWGAFNFLTTQGEPDKAASARRTIQNAAIGLGILLLSTRIVSFIGTSIT